MSDLAEWLLACIDEDEAVAREAALVAGGVGFGEERIDNGKVWSHRYHEVVRPIVPGVSDRRTLADCGGFGGLGIAPHVARHDPARVLAECEAKRSIVKLHYPLDDDPEPFCWNCDEERWPCGTMVALASPYADRPGFREEWRA